MFTRNMIVLWMLLTCGTVQGVWYPDVNLDHCSVGGSHNIFRTLNSFTMETTVMLNARFSHPHPITSWQFFAESTRPFYASLWRTVDQDSNSLTVELVDYNWIKPVKPGYQEIRIFPEDQINTMPGDAVGIFYAQEDQVFLNDSPQATISVEQSDKPPTDGVTDHLFDCVVDEYLPGKPLEKGYRFTSKIVNKQPRLLALRAIHEPDIKLRGLPRVFHSQYMIEGANCSIPQFNVGRKWGTICDEGTHNIAIAWGDQACQRAYQDKNYVMVTSFQLDTTFISPNAPIPAPILFNPLCAAQQHQMFGEGCVNSGSCDITSTRAIICASKYDVEAWLAKMEAKEEPRINFVM